MGVDSSFMKEKLQYLALYYQHIRIMRKKYEKKIYVNEKGHYVVILHLQHRLEKKGLKYYDQHIRIITAYEEKKTIKEKGYTLVVLPFKKDRLRIKECITINNIAELSQQ